MKQLIFGILFYAVFASGQAITSHDVVHQEGATASVGFSQNGGFFQLDVSRGTVEPGTGLQVFILYQSFVSLPDAALVRRLAVAHYRPTHSRATARPT